MVRGEVEKYLNEQFPHADNFLGLLLY
jgi:hypothetical protein